MSISPGRPADPRASMPGTGTVAYLILAHAADAQLEMLISTLLGDHRSRVYLHLDRKTADLGFLASLSDPRFTALASRVVVNWGGYSIVSATLELLRRALQDREAQRFVLLSGSCFPLRSPSDLNDAVLSETSPVTSVWGRIDQDLREGEGLGRYTVTKYFPLDVPLVNPRRDIVTERIWNLYKRVNVRLPYERKVDVGDLWRGSQFFQLDRALAERSVEPQDALTDALRYALAPDELYFTTLYVRYRRERGLPMTITSADAPLQGIHYVLKRVPPGRTIKEKLIKTIDLRRLTIADVSTAIGSGALFTRKCSASISQAIAATWDHPPAELARRLGAA